MFRVLPKTVGLFRAVSYTVAQRSVSARVGYGDGSTFLMREPNQRFTSFVLKTARPDGSAEGKEEVQYHANIPEVGALLSALISSSKGQLSRTSKPREGEVGTTTMLHYDFTSPDVATLKMATVTGDTSTDTPIVPLNSGDRRLFQSLLKVSLRKLLNYETFYEPVEDTRPPRDQGNRSSESE
eukprot:NODE_9180_length_658_cov_41.267290_g8916_i0.p1 GENE.NODE_9180_length_658_cov_41.267290_g8916_i0~~NODE_9180_length_658_cov_41.267290_g8916_i0.p1  ORF type:complete len:200 (-),score=39.81 NODE_9180_length_658_cov_41.267290_g8916_i0:59-607(-)